MGKKQYEKPEIRDFIPPSVHGDISPMGMCSIGNSAHGTGACEIGNNVDTFGDNDCTSGGTPWGGICGSGSGVTSCGGGSNA